MAKVLNLVPKFRQIWSHWLRLAYSFLRIFWPYPMTVLDRFLHQSITYVPNVYLHYVMHSWSFVYLCLNFSFIYLPLLRLSICFYVSFLYLSVSMYLFSMYLSLCILSLSICFYVSFPYKICFYTYCFHQSISKCLVSIHF